MQNRARDEQGLIRLSVRGLAKFMTATPAQQRKILRDFKFPDEDEPRAMRLYYKDAIDRIHGFHASSRNTDWLLEQAAGLEQLARLTSGRARGRLRNNARALADYCRHFSQRVLEPQEQLRLAIPFKNVLITVTPDLHVLERGKRRIIKFDFSQEAPDPVAIRVVSQIMYEAAKPSVPNLSSSMVLYTDVGRGREHKGARVGSRMLREVEAACSNIASLWGGI